MFGAHSQILTLEIAAPKIWLLLFACLLACLFACLFACLLVCLFVCLFACDVWKSLVVVTRGLPYPPLFFRLFVDHHLGFPFLHNLRSHIVSTPLEMRLRSPFTDSCVLVMIGGIRDINPQRLWVSVAIITLEGAEMKGQHSQLDVGVDTTMTFSAWMMSSWWGKVKGPLTA